MQSLLALSLLSVALTQAGIPQQAQQYRKDMTQSAYRVFGPGAQIHILAAQIHQESAWKHDAKSWVGAQGLAQFMPATAADMAKNYPQECAPANPYSPKWAFTCRDRYLRAQMRASKKPLASSVSECSEFAFGLRAYNGGLGWINRDRRKALQAGADPDNWVEVEKFNAGRNAAAIKENREYPHRIFRLSARYAAAGWGGALTCI